MTAIQIFIVGVLCVAFLFFVAHTLAGAVFMVVVTTGFFVVAVLAEDSCRAFDRNFPDPRFPGKGNKGK